MTVLGLILFIVINCEAIWPPGYSINLTEEGNFVISDDISSDTDDVYDDDDEMIKKHDLHNFALNNDTAKYYQIHRMALQHNRVHSDEKFERMRGNVKVFETNFENEEPLPWEVGFVHETENQNVLYLNSMTQYTINEKINSKREEELARNITEFKSSADYDYSKLESEYQKQMKNAIQLNDTLNHTEAKEEELIKEAMHKLVDFKETPRNCTEEEKKGIGIGTVECFWLELKKPMGKTERNLILKRIGRFVLIWFSIYLVIAIPCWCHKGWCCCCFQCRFCKPRLRIDEAKTFLMNNPPGTYYIGSGNEKVVYTPTRYEEYEYKRFQNILLKL